MALGDGGPDDAAERAAHVQLLDDFAGTPDRVGAPATR